MRDSEVNLKTIWAIAFIAIAVNICAAQTPIDVPDNSYSIRDDVRLGRKAAVEIEKQLPLVDRYERIIEEANLLKRSRPARHDSAQFQRARRTLLTMAPAPSMQQAIRRGN